MEPTKNFPDYDLDALDLEIYSTTLPQKHTKKHSGWYDLLNKTYVKTSLTLALLLFLFASTFFIASRVSKPAFTTSSAEVEYIPQAQIEMPLTSFIQSCSDLKADSESPSFLADFCRGDWCSLHNTADSCENVDVVIIENKMLSEVSGRDGINDCIWIENESLCRPKY